MTMLGKSLLHRVVLMLLGVGGASMAHAQDDLLQVFELALRNDPVVRQARAQYNASHTQVAESRSTFLPQVTLTGSTQRATQAPTEVHSFADGFNLHQYGVNLTQNFLNFEAWYNLQSVKESDQQALVTLAQAEQQLILRVATAYFDVLRSQDNLNVLQAQETAAQQVMDQAQQRFDLGFAEISDVYDSQAAFSQARVNRMDEENLLRQRLQTLEVISGGDHELLQSLSEQFPVEPAQPMNVEAWLSQTQSNNLNIRAATHTLASSENAAKAARAAMLPTLSISANYNDTSERANPYAFINDASNSTAISLNVNVPLFRGGASKARMSRAYYTVDANSEVLEQVTRQSLATARNSYNSIENSVRTVAARAENIEIARSAVEATEVGLEVGTRNTVDLVQAQRVLFQALRDYANARYDYILNTLTLKQAAGTLSPQDVSDLNQWLE